MKWNNEKWSIETFEFYREPNTKAFWGAAFEKGKKERFSYVFIFFDFIIFFAKLYKKEMWNGLLDHISWLSTFDKEEQVQKKKILFSKQFFSIFSIFIFWLDSLKSTLVLNLIQIVIN